ncbi:MAG TPA: pentapeptide repeat-containing protein [Luteimicrobium sp.]|nr:pentapeptide repeat-containing protein [Luteimicrobium sp.]
MPHRALPTRRLPAGPWSVLRVLLALLTLGILGSGAWAAPASAATPQPEATSTASDARAAVCATTRGAALRGRTLTQHDADARDLRCADLRGAHLAGLDLTQADLRGARLAGADLRGTELGQAELTAADLTGARAAGAKLGQASLQRAVLDDADLTGAELSQATAPGVSLRGADLSRATLVQATLTGADLTGATLHDTRLGQADLRGARLDGADLAGADLSQADLTGASLAGTVLAGTDLTQTTRPGGYGDAEPSGDAPLDAIAAVATLLLALGIVLPRLRSAARRRRDGKDLRGTGPAAVLAGLLVLAAAVGLAAAELRADLDWSDVLMVLPMITVLGFLALIAGGVMLQARWGVLGAVAAALGLAGYAVLTATIMSALLGSVFGEYPRAPSCTAATCAWGSARGWTGVAVGVALLVLCWLVGLLTQRFHRTHPARPAHVAAGTAGTRPTGAAPGGHGPAEPAPAQPVAARTAGASPGPAAPSGDANASAYQAVRDFRKR